ncbi:A-kinase-interacting protein 1 [Hoplias malabaricus]|uniref:A-kinase-interacting protein 1 n=1 Tax=Hoplias malabaricus TaxID=27720 RepID=UPI0034637BB0
MKKPSMAAQSWWETSLQRSSRLGREVLERAKRRSVDWPNERRPNQKHSEKEERRQVLEDPCVSASLDQAFDRIVQHMSETSRQCKNFYHTVGAAKVSEKEKTHMCRFHTPQLLQATSRCQPTTMTSTRVHYTGLSEPEDFLIEVSPGTYAITAEMQDAGPQTRVVHINAGESKNLRFDL